MIELRGFFVDWVDQFVVVDRKVKWVQLGLEWRLSPRKESLNREALFFFQRITQVLCEVFVQSLLHFLVRIINWILRSCWKVLWNQKQTKTDREWRKIIRFYSVLHVITILGRWRTHSRITLLVYLQPQRNTMQMVWGKHFDNFLGTSQWCRRVCMNLLIDVATNLPTCRQGTKFRWDDFTADESSSRQAQLVPLIFNG